MSGDESSDILRQASVASSLPMDDYEYDEDDDTIPPTPRPDLDDPRDYTCLKPEDIVEEQLNAVEEVNNIFEISPSTARALLVHCRWDKERLLELYYSGEQEKLFEDSKVVSPNKQRRKEPISEDAKMTCQICFDERPAKDMSGLDCEHTFCSQCWADYLHVQVAESNERITCPSPGCQLCVDEFTVAHLLKDPEDIRRYKVLVSRSFVRENPRVAWCPRPDCQNAIKVTFREPRVVRCLCGCAFCFACRNQEHTPIQCELLKMWLKKCSDDSATACWITANTKECPKCHVSIEKNGGCNHMTCKGCKNEFCWICMGLWSDHSGSYYECNKFREQEGGRAEPKTENRRALERYLFYFHRYQNHDESSALEARLSAAVTARQEELQQAHMSWIEVQYLKDALEVLATCRSVLKYSYAFVYYAKRNAQLDLFEIHQSSLEQATEALSHLLENKTDATVADMKVAILDKVSYCQSLRNVLVKIVREGLSSGAWMLVDSALEAMKL